jgi:hypothetical protein
MFLASILCLYIPVGALIVAVIIGSWGLAIGGLAGLAVCLFIIYRQGKAFVVKRSLSADDRRVIIDALAADALISAEEAEDLRRRLTDS